MLFENVLFFVLKNRKYFFIIKCVFLFLENISDPSFSSIIDQDNFLQMVH